MKKGRLEAFSDGVLAIVITIMVLELEVPKGNTIADLQPLLSVFGSYVLSFVYIGIYWNNHHHLLHTFQRVSGAILWANLHLLFWLSLVPFATAWMGENDFAPATLALYGVVMSMCAIAYNLLQRAILLRHGRNSLLAHALGKDIKGKVSLAAYLAAIPGAFFSPWISVVLFVLVALMWLVPDKRIERALHEFEEADDK